MVWSIHNAVNAGEHTSYRSFSQFNMEKFAEKNPEMERFWDPVSFTNSVPKNQWWTGVDTGKKIQDSWDAAYLYSSYLIEAGGDTFKLHSLIPSPFPNDQYMYWTGMGPGLAGDPSNIPIGNSNFSIYYLTSQYG